MAMMITQNCIACGDCLTACPNGAIQEGFATDIPVYWIDAEKCTECLGFDDELQCVEVCPVGCIVPNPDYFETAEELLAKARRFS